MSDVHGAAFVGSFFLLGGAWASWWFASRKRERLLLVEQTPTRPVAGAPHGLVEFKGSLKALPGGLSRAPMSGRPCVWWRFRLEVGRRDSHDESYRWDRVDSAGSELMLLLADHSGECLIDPRGASIKGARSQRWEGYSDKQAVPGAKNFVGRPSVRYRYIEEWLAEGDPLYALGELQGADALDPSSGLASLQKEVQYQWQRDHHQDMLDHFDKDGDDWLDPGELKAVAHDSKLEAGRRMAAIIEQLPPLDCLRQPANDQAFLLSRNGEEVESLKLHLSVFALRLLAAALLAAMGGLWFRVVLPA